MMSLPFYLQKKHRTQWFFAGTMLFIVSIFPGFLMAAQDATQIQLVVTGCNNNSSCESNLGENVTNCPLDCTSVSATTSSPTSSGSGGSTFSGTSGLFSVDTISIEPNTESVVLSWTTGTPVISTVMWGTTPDYEIGTLSEAIIKPSHNIKIENLLPGKGYYYRIDFKDLSGRTIGQISSAFATQPVPLAPDKTPPVNPRFSSIVPSLEKVVFRWQNPEDIDFAGVRLTRSTYTYPRDPFEGKIIYEGRGNSVADIDIEQGSRYYYALFAKDTNGNYSSGAIYSFNTQKEDVGKMSSKLADTESKISFNLGLGMRDLSVSDFSFTQSGVDVNAYGTAFVVDVRKPVTVSLSYESVPEILKTIILHVQDPENPDERNSFLLRVNEEKTKYESTIGAFEHIGKVTFLIEVIDFNNKRLSSVGGDFLVQDHGKDSMTRDNLVKSLNKAISEAPLLTKTFSVVGVLILAYLLIRILWIL